MPNYTNRIHTLLFVAACSRVRGTSYVGIIAGHGAVGVLLRLFLTCVRIVNQTPLLEQNRLNIFSLSGAFIVPLA